MPDSSENAMGDKSSDFKDIDIACLGQASNAKKKYERERRKLDYYGK